MARRSLRFLVLGVVVLVLLLAVGLVGSVLTVGLFVSSPVQRVVGPAPSTLPGAEAVAFSFASGTVLRGWWWPRHPAVAP